MDNKPKNEYGELTEEQKKNLSPEIQDFLTKYPSKQRGEKSDDAPKTPTLW